MEGLTAPKDGSFEESVNVSKQTPTIAYVSIQSRALDGVTSLLPVSTIVSQKLYIHKYIHNHLEYEGIALGSLLLILR